MKNLDRLQSFVDLGCGNGLLVFILASEGHLGLGVDVRKRVIWDMYPKFVKLEVSTIEKTLRISSSTSSSASWCFRQWTIRCFIYYFRLRLSCKLIHKGKNENLDICKRNIF